MAPGKMNHLSNLEAEAVNSGMSPLENEFHPPSSSPIHPPLFLGSRSSSMSKKTAGRSGNDSFAEVMNMMRSKKPYVQVSSPLDGRCNGSPNASTRPTTPTPAACTTPSALSIQTGTIQSDSFHAESPILIDVNVIEEDMERHLSALKAAMSPPQTAKSQITSDYIESPTMVGLDSMEDMERHSNILSAGMTLLSTKTNRPTSSCTESPVVVDKDSIEKGMEIHLNNSTAGKTLYQKEKSCGTSCGSTNGGTFPITPAKRPALSIQTRTARPTSISTESGTATDIDSPDERIDCRPNKLEANEASQEMVDCMSETSFVTSYSDMLSPVPDFSPPSVHSPLSNDLVARSPHQILSNTKYGNAPIVRVSMDVWDKTMNEISTLKERNGVLESGNRQREREDVCGIAYEIDQKTGQVCYELDQTKKYNAEMTRTLRQKDIEISHKDLGIKLLEEQVKRYEVMIEELTKCNRELKYAQKPSVSSAEVASLKNEITELKAQIARSEIVSADQTTRAKNLVDTQVQREKKIKKLEEKLLETQDAEHKWQDKYDNLRESLPSKKVFLEVQAKFTNKTSECDRMRNELKMVLRKLDLARKGLEASEGRKALQGACHLVVPKPTTVLPKNVYPCMECAIKNIDCDDKARCTHCFTSEDHCQRWRCSVHHVSGRCNQTPCRMFHDVNGWLLSRMERSQW